MTAAADLIINEELAADNKEQKNSGDDISGIFVQIELCCNLRGSILHKYQEEGNEQHGEGIEL